MKNIIKIVMMVLGWKYSKIISNIRKADFYSRLFLVRFFLDAAKSLHVDFFSRCLLPILVIYFLWLVLYRVRWNGTKIAVYFVLYRRVNLLARNNPRVKYTTSLSKLLSDRLQIISDSSKRGQDTLTSIGQGGMPASPPYKYRLSVKQML